MVGVKVKGGTGKSVLIKPEKLSETIIPIGKSEDVTYKLEIPEYIEAPINKNKKIGELIYYLGDDEIYRTAIVASDSVEEMTFSNALLILFKSCISF